MIMYNFSLLARYLCQFLCFRLKMVQYFNYVVFLVIVDKSSVQLILWWLVSHQYISYCASWSKMASCIEIWHNFHFISGQKAGVCTIFQRNFLIRHRNLRFPVPYQNINSYFVQNDTFSRFFMRFSCQS